MRRVALRGDARVGGRRRRPRPPARPARSRSGHRSSRATCGPRRRHISTEAGASGVRAVRRVRCLARHGAERRWQVDLALLQGDSIEADLARRDFTVNAIAEPLEGGELIDPHDGVTAVRERVLRMVSPEAFDDDPLRVLRLARSACVLGLHPEDATIAAAACALAASPRSRGAELRRAQADPRGRRRRRRPAPDGRGRADPAPAARAAESTASSRTATTTSMSTTTRWRCSRRSSRSEARPAPRWVTSWRRRCARTWPAAGRRDRPRRLRCGWARCCTTWQSPRRRRCNRRHGARLPGPRRPGSRDGPGRHGAPAHV